MLPSFNRRSRNGGFSLLEMVVAVAILGMSLGVLYQSVSGATRIVRIDEKYAYAVELARSLLADNTVVPLPGLNNSGDTAGGFSWSVLAAPLVLPQESPLEEGLLQQIRVSVRWNDGDKQRVVDLRSIVAGQELTP